MESIGAVLLPIVLAGLAGAFLGGAVSLRRQGRSPAFVMLLGVLGVLAAGGAVLWLLP